ncbi:S41 family peptidase [Hymenobacter pini]|uniref:S41 family peptidase n=1 Tax=Hymenobacter pini TaxID=2880879 RepID=UPI001CF239DE|nr:S41 family peptidase [Hymenobacter pini]MCA8833247.1 hypothetical protein [Hymenobacter pini]
MKRTYPLVALVAAGFSAQAQQPNVNLNLDFEQIVRQTQQPARWWSPGANGYSVEADSVVKHQGRYALCLQGPSQPSTIKGASPVLGVASVQLPIGFRGQTVKLTGYLKTDNVQNGYAGLWLREDGPNGTLQLNNMSKQNLRGTTSWQQYSVTLPLEPDAKSLLIGGLLTGTGTVWLDQLELTVDGKPWWQAPAKVMQHFKAEQDTAFRQGSGISLQNLSKQQLENLAVLGRVWGFAKYYHPVVARGEVNMDAELFRVLPKVLQASNLEARSQVLSIWLTSLGPVPACPTCREPKPKDVRLQPDLAWLTDKRQVSPALSQQLVYLRQNRNQGLHYYVRSAPHVENPLFEHEETYPSAPGSLPDDGLRVLSLFRYWNMIDYFFPYRYAIGEDWQQVLPEFLPKMVEARTPEQYRLTALALIARLNDSHASVLSNDQVLTAYWGNYHAPAQVRFVEKQPVVTGYFHPELGPASGLQLGDVVLSIDGRKVKDILTERKPLTPASNEPTQLRNMARDLLRGRTEQVQLVVRRDGKELPLSITRYPATKLNLALNSGTPGPKAPAWHLLPGNIGHLSLGTIQTKDLPAIMQEARGTKGLIIDIRNYPSDFVVFSLSRYLLAKPQEFVRFTSPQIAYPGMFLLSEPLQVMPGKEAPYAGKVVILVNELSQSQSEYTTMALRTVPGSVVMGSTTAGADGNVSAITLPGNLGTRITGLGVYYPDGRETQRIGIVPDIEVKPTITGIKAGRDEVLERAVAHIEKA